MKRLLLIFILTFSFQSLTKAGDISEFEIEGMSVGDSLLDFLQKWDLTEEQIKNSPKTIYPGSKKFYGIKIIRKSDKYDNFGFLLKENDKKYIIYILRGKKVFANDLENCKKYKKKVVDNFKDLLKNIDSDDYIYKYKHDEGKSVSYITDYTFKDGSGIRVYCDNWSTITEDERSWEDSLNVEINSAEGINWINTEAY